MERFGQFFLDKEKDIVVELYRDGTALHYVLRTPNHSTGNLITNLAKLCALPLSEDAHGLKIIRGTIPCYVDGNNERVFIFRLGNTKVANIRPDGKVELKASIPSISKVLMSQTRQYRLNEMKTIVKTYIFDDVKFRADLHTHMSANLEPDVLIALGIRHQIRYPLYYIKKLGLRLTAEQREQLERDRETVAVQFAHSALTGKYRDRKIDDNCFLNFADLILNNPGDAAYNISRIRNSLAVPKDGQAVFADLEKVYLYRYVFTKGVTSEQTITLRDDLTPADADIARILRRMLLDMHDPSYAANTLFQNKLLWIARSYRRYGIDYAEISDTALCKQSDAPRVLREIHAVMPAVTGETGVTLRFLAALRRTPLTIVRDNITPNDALAENLQVLRAVASDPYIAGSDIVGEEINDISELRGVMRELVRIANENTGFVIRIHAGENDSLRDNVAGSIRLVRDSLAPNQPMPPVRIGHGLYTANLHSSKGQKLLRELRENDIVLEFQLTSNVRLNNLSDLEHHPLKDYLRGGVRCVQGTDGGALYGTNSIDEELALEKLLGLRHEDLLQMRRAEASVVRKALEAFREKQAAFPDTDAEILYRARIAKTARPEAQFWRTDGRLNAAEALADRIAPLPDQGLPVILAGGSFSGDRRATQMHDTGKALIDALLTKADPERVFFVVGHRLTGYERYLVERAAGRFRIYAIVPTAITPAERDRLRRFGVGVRLSIEPSGHGIYKSFSYEIFKRRASVLLALEGKSPCANLVQEAKNARAKCAIYVDGTSRVLRAKAKSLQGYVRILQDLDDPVREILS